MKVYAEHYFKRVGIKAESIKKYWERYQHDHPGSKRCLCPDFWYIGKYGEKHLALYFVIHYEEKNRLICQIITLGAYGGRRIYKLN